MNKASRPDLAWTATVLLLSFLLFYLPVMLTVFNSNEPHEWIVTGVVMSTLYAAIFYLNYFRIVPLTLIRSNNKPLFFCCNIVLILLACSLIPLWFELHGGLPGPGGHHPDTPGGYLMAYLKFIIRDGVMMVLSAALAYALRISREQDKMRRRELELDAERHNIELKSLKAQLNPHFLFNAINNIYALIAVSSDRAQKALYEFSGILRFLIYDAAAEYVPFHREMAFIRDFVELMKLRFSNALRIDCELSEEGTEKLSIAPLILLTLVENAFKHVSRTGPDRFISIRAGLEGQWLVFRVSNSCTPGAPSAPSVAGAAPGSGVGLVNVESQLRLLYPGAHTLIYGEIAGVYTAEVRIACSRLVTPTVPAPTQF